MIYRPFLIKICVKTYSVILFIREKCNKIPKNIYFFIIKNSECIHIFQMSKNVLFLNRNMSLTLMEVKEVEWQPAL